MSPHSERSEAPEGICRCSSVQNGGLPDKSGADFAGSEDPTCPNCRQIWISSSSTSGSADLVLKSERDWERFRRLIEAAGKGFAIGTGIKGGLAVFSILARLRSRRFLNSSRKVGLMTNSEAIVKATKETLRYGLFLGTFAGTFVSVDELIAALGGHSRTASWRALLAGAIAGPSMLLTGTNTQHTSLAIYILMRAAVLASRCGIKSKQIGSICKPLTWIHGDIFLMCLSSSQILSSYILKQDSLPLAYKSFLNKHGGKDLVILQGVKDIASGVHLTNLKGIENYYSSIGVDIKLDPEMKVPCTIVHGNQSCTGHFFSFLFEAYKRALPVYIPVYLIPALIVHRKGLLKRFFTIQKGRLGRDCSINHLIICDTGCSPLTELEIYTWLLHLSRRPYTILGKNVLGTTRSSLFLSVYCSSAWIWTCLLFRLFKRCNVPMVAMGTFPTGLALLIEKKSRRIEISLYCFARAIESFFTCISDAGYLPHAKRFKRADVALFSISTAIIMHCYAQERDVFRSKYLNVLDWVFGVPPTCVKCDSSENNNVHNS